MRLEFLFRVRSGRSNAVPARDGPALAQWLDPEQLRELMRACHQLKSAQQADAAAPEQGCLNVT